MVMSLRAIVASYSAPAVSMPAVSMYRAMLGSPVSLSWKKLFTMVRSLVRAASAAVLPLTVIGSPARRFPATAQRGRDQCHTDCGIPGG